MNHARKQVAPDTIMRGGAEHYGIGGHLLTRVVHCANRYGLFFARSLEAELKQEAANLRQLLEATEEAAAEMARLTLSAGRWQVSEASDKFAKLGWAARELRQFNRQLDE